jgi:hypothetical protein
VVTRNISVRYEVPVMVTMNISLRYEVPVMVTMNITAVWYVMYSKLVAMYQPFGGSCCLYLSDESSDCICPECGCSG